MRTRILSLLLVMSMLVSGAAMAEVQLTPEEFAHLLNSGASITISRESEAVTPEPTAEPTIAPTVEPASNIANADELISQLTPDTAEPTVEPTEAPVEAPAAPQTLEQLCAALGKTEAEIAEIVGDSIENLRAYPAEDIALIYNMLTGEVSMNTLADSYTDDQEIEYTLDTENNTATVTYGWNASGSITIPATITEGSVTYNVTAIGNGAFASNMDITEVIIQEGIETIGENAFDGCDSLQEVTIPASVTSIGYSAFLNCDALTTVSLEANGNLQNIGAFAFCECYLLEGPLTIPKNVTSIGESAFAKCSQLTSLKFEGTALKSIGDSAFAGCEGLTGALTIPYGVTEIGASAFHSCSKLNGELTIPDTVTDIGKLAFCNCVGLIGSFYIPANATEISSGIYFGCEKLSGPITIPKTVTTIGSDAFGGCVGLTGTTGAQDGELIIPETVTTIGDTAFLECTQLTKVVIPENITTIESQTFFGCSGLTSITIPDGVTSIGMSAFRKCTSLKNIKLPNDLEAIYNYAFAGCTGLQEIEIPDGVALIGGNAFENCTALQEVTIPEGTSDILGFAFSGCTSLQEVTLPTTVNSIAQGLFRDSGLTTLTLKSENIDSVADSAFNGITVEVYVYEDSTTHNTLQSAKEANSWTNVTIKFITSDGDVEATATNYSGVYDGYAHSITVTPLTEDATVLYSRDGENYVENNPSFTNVTDGPVTVYYKVKKSGYASCYGSATVNITAKEITVSGITANDKTYDGNNTATLNFKNVTLEGKVDGDDLTVSAIGTFENENAGKNKTVDIRELTLGGDAAGNYFLAQNGQQSTATADINAKDVTVTITPNGGIYGTITPASAVVHDAVDDENPAVTLTYTGKANNGKEVNGTDIPENAGKYTVTAAITDTNYNLTGTVSADFVVEKATVKIPSITSEKNYTGQTLTADVLDSDDSVYYTIKNNGGIEVGEYDVVLTLKDADNTKWSDDTEAAEIKLKFKIVKEKNNGWETEPSIDGWTYGNTASVPSYEAKFGHVVVEYCKADESEETYTTNVPTEAGDYKVRFTVFETSNYVGLSEVINLRIEQKTIGIEWTPNEFTYTGEAQVPTATATDLKDGDSCSITVEVEGESTDVGTYTATAIGVSNTNYKLPEPPEESLKCSFTITAAVQDAPSADSIVVTHETIVGKKDGSIKVNGEAKPMEYSTDGGTTWSDIDTTIENLEPGTYEVRYKKDKNHDASDPMIITIEAGQLLSVDFNSNGGSNVAGITDLQYGAEITIPAAPTKAHHTFVSWNTAENGSGTNYDPGTKINVTSNMTFYAKWTKNNYLVTFNANGGEGTMSAQSFASGELEPLNANEFTRKNFYFVGWNTAADGSGEFYTNKQAVAFTKNTTLYAQWARVPSTTSYTVQYNANGGTGSVYLQAFTSSMTFNLRMNEFVREGYTFAGWNTKADGTGDAYAEGASFSGSIKKSIVLYAQWKLDVPEFPAVRPEYKIEVEGQEGKITRTNDTSIVYDKMYIRWSIGFETGNTTFAMIAILDVTWVEGQEGIVGTFTIPVIETNGVISGVCYMVTTDDRANELTVGEAAANIYGILIK